MSISTATDERTEGDDDTSQGSHPKEDSSDSENENEPQSHNGGSPSPEVHEITSDEDDDCVVTNEDDSSNSSTDSNESSDASQHSNKETKETQNEESLENGGNESDVEEVTLEDPLNQPQNKSKPIVVSDTKSLADLALKQTKSNSDQNKEPTVVIIDTNSILSGKGPTPVQSKPPSTSSSSIDAQNLCQSIAARGTTITPVSSKNNSTQNNVPATQPNILPSLTDDMFVVEAPSFIVPYVYEKPSIKPFREFVDKLGKELEELKLKEDFDKLEKERLEKERKEKERKERIERGEIEDEELESEKEVKVPEENNQKKSQKKQRRKRGEEDDDSWDGESSSESEDDALSDDDAVVIKDRDDTINDLKDPISLIAKSLSGGKPDSYFDCSLGQFFINIGLNLVQEFVQSDLLKQQNRKLYKEKKSGRSTKATESAIASLTQNLEFSKKTNAPYALQQKKCEFCSFKTESALIMAHHLEAPHMKNNIYKCNTCDFEIRSPHDILFHMEAEHNIRGRLERAPAYQQCANCHFEDNSKTKLARHLIACAKKFKPEFNLGPPLEWEPPAKIPKLTRGRNNMMGPYQSNYNRPHMNLNNIGRPQLNMSNMVHNSPVMGRPRGRPPISGPPRPQGVSGVPIIRSGVMIMHNTPPGTTIANYPLMQNAQNNTPTAPKISITPLPRAPQPSSSQTSQNSKATFVICEICDGYIKDLEQLRNHMQWIHKVKIHPKMIYNRPPLNCQKCQFRFFTDQGLERHLLGSHGLVTSSMQEAANKGKDAGRCPVCGRVYQWKLLNHVSRDHNMTLKPAHLSYKCTVCTATFGMYKQFENHVYSAHSVVAKRVMDKSKTNTNPAKPTDTESVLKPLKISDEITIIPQPAKSTVTITAKGK